LRPRPATTPHQVHEPQAFAAYLERRLEKVMACQPSHPDSKHLRERLPVANPGIQAETDWWMRWCSGATSGTP